MADFHSRNFNTSFSGLITTVIIMGAVGGACLVGFETLRQMKRLPGKRFVPFWKGNYRRGGVDAQDDTGVGIGSRRKEKDTQEDWEMGHLYHARTFHATNPSPPLAQWPLAWSWQALRLDDWFYATHCGMDNVVYVRFLRGCVWWMLLQTFTTAPILLAIHFRFSKGVEITDMSRASLAYLVTIPGPGCTGVDSATSSECKRIPNEQGRKLLWIHLCLTWYLTATWFYTLWWIAKGSLAIRRRLVEKIKTDRQAGIDEAEEKRRQEAIAAEIDDQQRSEPMRRVQGLPMDADNSEGWRQRTLLVTNLPATMRDEASIRRYFEEFLRPDDATDDGSEASHSRAGSIVELDTGSEEQGSSTQQEEGSSPIKAGDDTIKGNDAAPALSQPVGPQPDLLPRRHLRSPVQTVVLVRKMNELSAMLSRRQEILQLLEAAHVKLAKTVLEKVASRRAKDEKKQRKHFKSEAKRQKHEKDEGSNSTGATSKDVESDAATEALESQRKKALDDLAERLAKFLPRTSNEEDRVNSVSDTKPSLDEETVWEALAEVPRELLDPHQPVTSLSTLFRGQKVPTIDYLLTKLNLLTALVAEMRARPPTEYEATSTAFVTLRDPRQARMVWRELHSQIVIKVRMAPEVKDLDWDRLMRTSFTGDLVRGFGVNAFFWAFTVFWLIPLQLISTALFSVQNLKHVIPGLANFFESHQQLEAFVSVTLPTVIVSLITMSIPELVFQISKRAQGFVTWSALYDQCLCRYWKFIVCNIVIFFCVGVTTVEAILQQIGSNGGKNTILDNIAFAFPTAAPFFVSYLILALALHSGFELLGFMVPILQHFLSANKATTPRARALRTLPRNFNRYYWLPFHILIMTIVFIFAILNPLVIPFALVYLFIAMIVFKKNFAFVYYRRFMEKEGAIYFIRLFRFTLDGLTTAQIVILIFFSVTDQQKAYIALTALLLPITVGFKILGTKLWKSQCRAIEDDEANAICGIATSSQALLGSGADKDYGESGLTNGEAAPLDARASGRYPAHVAPPATQSRLLRIWQNLHDAFHADGADQPSYLAVRAAKGQPVKHPVFATAAFVAHKPFAAARKAGQETRQVGHVAKLHLNIDRSMRDDSTKDLQQAEEEAAKQSVALGQRAKAGVAMERRVPTNSSVRYRSASMARRGASTSAVETNGGLARGVSVRSRMNDAAVPESPFLSGFEAVANHAPVMSEDAYADFEDGEESTIRVIRSTPRRSRRSMRESSVASRRMRSQGYTEDGGIVPSHSASFARSPSLGRGLPHHHGGDSSFFYYDQAEGKTAVIDGKLAAETKAAQEEEDNYSQDDDEDDLDLDSDDLPLVRPHAKIRWDDTPNNQARYNNPFYSCELDPFLWLPRDPLAPLNLCDTIEWHGPAIVSSDGGAGKVGEWEDEEEDSLEGIMDGGADIDDHATSFSRIGEIAGDEEIVMGTALAQRLEAEENASQAEAADPSASLPKNVLDEYRKAIRRDVAEGGGSAGSAGGGSRGSRGGGGGSRFEGGEELRPNVSNMSTSSIRSPKPEERVEADRGFKREQPQQPPLSSSPQAVSLEERRATDIEAAAAAGTAAAATGRTSPEAARKTHFAPDPPHPARQPGAMPLSQSLASIGTSGGPPSPTHHRFQSTGSQRRATNLSVASIGGGGAASIRSTTTAGGTRSGSKVVTMRQALQAEVLEEERRRSIRDRLAAKSSLKKKKGGGGGGGGSTRSRRDASSLSQHGGGDGHEAPLPEGEEEEEDTSVAVDEFGQRRRRGQQSMRRGASTSGISRSLSTTSSAIMARHERALGLAAAHRLPASELLQRGSLSQSRPEAPRRNSSLLRGSRASTSGAAPAGGSSTLTVTPAGQQTLKRKPSTLRNEIVADATINDGDEADETTQTNPTSHEAWQRRQLEQRGTTGGGDGAEGGEQVEMMPINTQAAAARDGEEEEEQQPPQGSSS